MWFEVHAGVNLTSPTPGAAELKLGNQVKLICGGLFGVAVKSADSI